MERNRLVARAENILGFTADIGAAASDLNLAVSLFFITFVLFQPISAAMGRRVGAKHWIPVIMVCLPRVATGLSNGHN